MNPNGCQKLLYDAKWSGPRGDLNPMGLKVPGLISVQIFPVTGQLTSGKWTLRNPDTKGELSPHRFISPSDAMAHLSKIFTKQETEWQIRNMDGTPYIVEEEEPVPEPRIYK
jgi:hypothetical protein